LREQQAAEAGIEEKDEERMIGGDDVPVAGDVIDFDVLTFLSE
jgi:hypothetical protein